MSVFTPPSVVCSPLAEEFFKVLLKEEFLKEDFLKSWLRLNKQTK